MGKKHNNNNSGVRNDNKCGIMFRSTQVYNCASSDFVSGRAQDQRYAFTVYPSKSAPSLSLANYSDMPLCISGQPAPT